MEPKYKGLPATLYKFRGRLGENDRENMQEFDWRTVRDSVTRQNGVLAMRAGDHLIPLEEAVYRIDDERIPDENKDYVIPIEQFIELGARKRILIRIPLR